MKFIKHTIKSGIDCILLRKDFDFIEIVSTFLNASSQTSILSIS